MFLYSIFNIESFDVKLVQFSLIYNQNLLFLYINILIMNIRTAIFEVNWLKTLYFNMRYLSLSKAIRLPILIYRNTNLFKMNGSIQFNVPIRFGMLKLGPHGLGTRDTSFNRTMWECTGKLIINGKASIGRGSRISIGNQAVLSLGDNFVITGDSSIICQKEIKFGKSCLLSWDIQIMDTDFHKIINEQGDIVNPPKSIIFGDKVWIGCKNTILKGVCISNDTIIASNSIITRSSNKSNVVIGGSGKNIEILKNNVTWEC